MAAAWIITKIFITMKIGRTTDQNPVSWDVNCIAYEIDWVCWFEGVIPVPGYNDNFV